QAPPAPLRLSFFSFELLPAQLSTFFPYTPLFRSVGSWLAIGRLPPAAMMSSPHTSTAPTGTSPASPAASAWPSAMRMKAPSRAQIGKHTSELQSRGHLVCRLLLEKKKRSGVKKLE